MRYRAFVGLLALLWTSMSYANNIDIEKLADSIFKAEGGYKAEYLYGIRSVSYKDEAEARQICINTINNTLYKYREARCKKEDTDLQCLGRRYCPLDVDNDPKGLNKHWQKNVAYFYKQLTGEAIK